MPSLSVILPAYNEEAMLPKTAKVLAQVLESENIDYELVFVDDGSKDLTWSEILTAHQTNERVHGVHFSRNFGKEAAIFAGLAAAKGDCAAARASRRAAGRKAARTGQRQGCFTV